MAERPGIAMSEDAAEIMAGLEDVFMRADEAGIWDELAALRSAREEDGEYCGYGWTWETFKALCVERGIV